MSTATLTSWELAIERARANEKFAVHDFTDIQISHEDDASYSILNARNEVLRSGLTREGVNNILKEKGVSPTCGWF